MNARLISNDVDSQNDLIVLVPYKWDDNTAKG